MKKFLIIFLIFSCFLPFFEFNYANANASNSEFVVVANSATIFSEPDFSSTKLKNLTHKDVISVELQETTPVEYGNEFVFFKVNFDDIEGYVLSDLLVPKNKTISSIPNFNAQTNSSCSVYVKNDTEFVKIETILEKGERIFLYEGYSNERDYIAIAYVKNNEIMYGYLQKDVISPDGINPIIITCISLIIAVIGIVFAWVFIKNKKVKLKK